MKYTTLLGRSTPVILSTEQVYNIINGIQTAFIIPVTNKDVYKVNDFLYVKEPVYMDNDKHIIFPNTVTVIPKEYTTLNAKQLNKAYSRLFLRVTSAKYTTYNSIIYTDLQHLGCIDKEELATRWQNTINTYKETYNKSISDKFLISNSIENNPNIQICYIEVINPEKD